MKVNSRSDVLSMNPSHRLFSVVLGVALLFSGLCLAHCLSGSSAPDSLRPLSCGIFSNGFAHAWDAAILVLVLPLAGWLMRSSQAFALQEYFAPLLRPPRIW